MPKGHYELACMGQQGKLRRANEHVGQGCAKLALVACEVPGICGERSSVQEGPESGRPSSFPESALPAVATRRLWGHGWCNLYDDSADNGDVCGGDDFVMFVVQSA